MLELISVILLIIICFFVILILFMLFLTKENDDNKKGFKNVVTMEQEEIIAKEWNICQKELRKANDIFYKKHNSKEARKIEVNAKKRFENISRIVIGKNILNIRFYWWGHEEWETDTCSIVEETPESRIFIYSLI